MKTLFTFTSIFLLINLFGCGWQFKNENFKIKFINNSEHDILIDYLYSYPDTSLVERHSLCGDIQPFSSSNCYNDISFQEAFSHNEHNILCFFVWDIDTIMKYGNEICEREYKILKRFDYSQQDLENMNWTLTYP